MDSSKSPLEEFHRSLSCLADECLTHLTALRRIGTMDDSVISESRADTLSSDQVQVLSRLRASLWREDPNSPVTAGKDILDAMDESNQFNQFCDVKLALRKCREFASYGSDTQVCHQALDVFEHEIEMMHSRLFMRLYSWPRSSLWGETARLEDMIRLLQDRKLHMLVAYATQSDSGCSNEILTSVPGESLGEGVQKTNEEMPGEKTIAAQTATHVPPLAARTHSDCFASVTWDGEPFTFTPSQAAVVKCLWMAMENGNSVITETSLLEKAGTSGNAIRHLFRSNGIQHKAWGKMIIKSGKYCFTLSPPKLESPI
jgi:hypothetical protein